MTPTPTEVREYWKISLHESGHCLVALHFGRVIDYVEISPGEGKVEAHCSDAIDDDSYYAQEVCIAVAGFLGTRMGYPNDPPPSARQLYPDIRRCCYCLSRLLPDDADRNEYLTALNWCIDLTCRILWMHKDAVVTLSNVLAAEGRLTGFQVNRVVGKFLQAKRAKK